MAKKLKSTCVYCGNEFYHNSSSTGKYCNNKCQADHVRATYLEQLKNGDFIGVDLLRPTLYGHLVEQKGNRCECCGITEWNDKPIRLWVDHVDGNALNNSWDNLRLVCPNCDSQLDTSRGKNRGKGRKSLGLKPS